MAKSTIAVRHKDEIFSELVQSLEFHSEAYKSNHHDYNNGYINALKWTLHMITKADDDDAYENLPFKPKPIPGTENVDE